jgi:hypothetical protein
MKRKTIAAAVTVLFVAMWAPTRTDAGRLQGDIGPEGGLRVDQFNWNEGDSPMWESELEWKNLRIWEAGVHASLRYDAWNGWGPVVSGRATAGTIARGDNTDTDYEFGQTIERSTCETGGDVADEEIDLGFRFELAKKKSRVAFAVTPLVGYSHHEMNLDDSNLNGDFGSYYYEGDVATYDATWQSIYVGVQGQMRFAKRVTMDARLTYHWADFDAKADWILRDDFAHPVSFEHTANGDGVVFRLGTSFAVTEHFLLGAAFTMQQWSAQDGTDRTYGADGSYADIEIHEINWSSAGASINAALTF